MDIYKETGAIHNKNSLPSHINLANMLHEDKGKFKNILGLF